MAKYYLDACIWIDFLEERLGTRGRPLGKYANDLFWKIMKNRDILLFSELTINEIKIGAGLHDIETVLIIAESMMDLRKVDFTIADNEEAKKISKQRDIPINDALNAVIARNNDAIMISQDKHFEKLKDITLTRKPEDII